MRVVKPPRVTSERYLSTWKDVSTLPAHPKEGEHAAIGEVWPRRARLAMAQRCYLIALHPGVREPGEEAITDAPHRL